MKKNKTKTKKSKPKKQNKTTKPKASKPKPVETNKTEEIMDRATLKSIATQLKGAGAEIKVLKSDTDEVLQKKVNAAVQQLPSPEVVSLLESVDPNKLLTVLKKDCLGIFVDFSDVSCVRCVDAVQCVSKFIGNLKDGMSVVKGAVVVTEAPKPEPEAKLTAATRYEAKRLVFVRDRKNPNKKGDDYYDTLQAVLDEQPETLGELREIVERDFDIEGDGDFMKFVTAMRDPKEGVIKLDIDLSEENKVELRKAGYEV